MEGSVAAAVGVNSSASAIANSAEQYIVATMPRERPTLPMTARALKMSPRTLQRNLVEANVSFSKLLTRVESDRARALLSDPNLRIREISKSLGYRDPSSFSRAFRNWTGISPRNYRQRLKNR